jgi:hypothetical protein
MVDTDPCFDLVISFLISSLVFLNNPLVDVGGYGEVKIFIVRLPCLVDIRLRGWGKGSSLWKDVSVRTQT